MSHKKSYKIEFPDAQDFFGMGESTDWALMSNSMDSSLLLNRITYWLGEQIGLPCQVQQIPVDVVMIGSVSGRKYLGSYTLCETVRIDKDRVSIPKLKKSTESEDPGETPNITGGYLLSYYSETQASDKPENTVFETGSGLKWMSRSPEAELMDMDSAADYWWIQTFSYNPDAFRTSSTYLYKTPDTASEKGRLCWGPLWDFDGGYYFGRETELGTRTGLNNTPDIWFDQLRAKDPLFVELLKERWQDPGNGMNVKLMELTREGGLLDRYRDEIHASWEANEQELFADLDPEYATDFDEMVELIRKWIDVRREWVNDNLDALDQVFFDVTYMVDGQEYASGVVRGNTNILINDMPEPPEKEGYVFVDWLEEESGRSILGYFIETDTVFTAEYADRTMITEPEEILFGRSEDQVSLDEGFYWIQYSVVPEDAMTGTIKWTSSDTDVAVADTEFIELTGTGDVTITATLWNGVSASLTLHVTEPEAAMGDE